MPGDVPPGCGRRARRVRPPLATRPARPAVAVPQFLGRHHDACVRDHVAGARKREQLAAARRAVASIARLGNLELPGAVARELAVASWSEVADGAAHNPVYRREPVGRDSARAQRVQLGHLCSAPVPITRGRPPAVATSPGALAAPMACQEGASPTPAPITGVLCRVGERTRAIRLDASTGGGHAAALGRLLGVPVARLPLHAASNPAR